MATYGSQKGFFDLYDSNNCVGSYFKLEHVKKIFDLDESISLDFIRTETKYKTDNLIGESDLRKLLRTGLIRYFPKQNIICENHPKRKSVQASFDEYVIKSLVKQILPDSKITHQFFEEKSQKIIDFKIENGNEKVFLEFDGPTHFTDSDKSDPLTDKKTIEDNTGIKCIRWPFWIQRCTRNIESIFNSNIKGYGALWSTNYLFGDFKYPNSASIIDELSKQFNAAEDGYEYFYFNHRKNRTNGVVKNPTHSIVGQIKNDKAKMDRLIPKGATEPERWIIKDYD